MGIFIRKRCSCDAPTNDRRDEVYACTWYCS